LKPDPLTLVTGTLFTPLLRSLVADSPAEVIPVVNRFFGETVTVAGLLTAQDVIEQLRARRLNAMVVLPAAMFGGPEGQSLDEMWPEDVAAALDRPVKVGAQIHQP
jgi:NifB/MoaA-like Fe-S oxidoreductase